LRHGRRLLVIAPGSAKPPINPPAETRARHLNLTGAASASSASRQRERADGIAAKHFLITDYPQPRNDGTNQEHTVCFCEF
jgi:hypothetical protein